MHRPNVRLGVIILAGGAASRMGQDKAALDWNGRSAVDRLAQVAAELGAEAIVTVGPNDHGWPRVVETPVGGGPVAGIVVGAAHLAKIGTDRLLVLAVDAPTVLAEDLMLLLGVSGPGAAYADLNLPLVMDLETLPAQAGAGWSVHRLIAAVGLVRLPVPAQARDRLRGANTPDERAALLQALIAVESAQKGGTP